MQVVAAEIDDPLAAGILHIGVADVPFARHRPVEHRGAAGDFVHIERDLLLQARQRLAKAVAGDAAADRVELLHQRVDGGAEHLGI